MGPAVATLWVDTRKRILFVDEHVTLLGALRTALRPKHKSWDLELAPDGNAALTVLARQPFDVVVTELRLPDIDGVQLLDQIRAQHPSTVRVMMSGVSEPWELARASPLVHQLLSKPCPVVELEGVLQRALDAGASAKSEALRRIVGQASELPAVPSVYRELVNTASRSDCNLEMLAAVVGRDVALSAKVLHLANSAYFNGSAAKGLEAAVLHLGLEMIKALALIQGVVGMGSDDPSLPAGLRVSTVSRTAVLGVRLVRELVSGQAAELAAVGALLRDLGTLVLMARAPEETRKAAERALIERKPRSVTELDAFGFSHADVGAYLLSVWGMSRAVVELVAQHHLPPQANPLDPVSAVALAAQLIAEAEGAVSQLDVPQLHRLGLAFELPRLRARVKVLREL